MSPQSAVRTPRPPVCDPPGGSDDAREGAGESIGRVVEWFPVGRKSCEPESAQPGGCIGLCGLARESEQGAGCREPKDGRGDRTRGLWSVLSSTYGAIIGVGERQRHPWLEEDGANTSPSGKGSFR